MIPISSSVFIFPADINPNPSMTTASEEGVEEFSPFMSIIEDTVYTSFCLINQKTATTKKIATLATNHFQWLKNRRNNSLKSIDDSSSSFIGGTISLSIHSFL